MMVSLKATSRKYRGAMARNYESKRMTQERWDRENEITETILMQNRNDIIRLIDVPVGTGRFLAMYKALGISVIGVDISEEMLQQARTKGHPVHLEIGDATKLRFGDQEFDAAVCVRFLDLIEEEAMQQVMHELFRVTKKHIILTIRLGNKYIAKSNTATHSNRKFKNLIHKNGWRIAVRHPIFKQGWNVMRLTKGAKT